MHLERPLAYLLSRELVIFLLGTEFVHVSSVFRMWLSQLVKQTDIQATGVASSLVELIENAGFKMQALSLGFDGDEAEDDDNIDYADEEATVE